MDEYVDMNPGDESIEYDNNESLSELIQHKEEKTGDIIWACPKCLTDAFLIDNKLQEP